MTTSHFNLTTDRTLFDATRRLTIAVVGAGPAGLTFANHMGAMGARVVVLEQRPDPRVIAVPDERSFNITLASMGLAASGAAERRIRVDAQRIVGRCIFVDGETYLTSYGLRPDDVFYSLPRHELNRILLEEAETAGVEVRYGHEVLAADPATGRIESRRHGHDVISAESFDLVVFADGVNGTGRALASTRAGCESFKQPREQYLKARISAEEARRAGLPVDRICFWPSIGQPTIAIPNADGSFNVLVIGQWSGPFHESPFATERQAQASLEERSPSLIAAVPDLARQLVGAKRGSFCNASITDWVLGPRAVLIGDAARCIPPYAGAGGAAAMNDAATLADHLWRHADIEQALAAFECNRRAASRVLSRMVEGHRQLLTCNLGSRGWRLASRVKFVMEAFFGRRDLYTTVVFERDGLARLVESELAAEGEPQSTTRTLLRAAAML